MVELLIVAGFVLIPLFLAIPLLGKYLDVRATAVQAARYAAWERTVWFGGSAASGSGWGNKKWLANAKDDDQIRKELGVRHLSQTGASDAFTSTDRSASTFRGGAKTMWQDRSGQQLLANYSDIQSPVANGAAPGSLNAVLGLFNDIASTLGPFVLEMNGANSATVSMKIRDIDYDHYLLKNSTTNFTETNMVLANGWSADGAADPAKTSVKQQVKGLVPTSIIATEIGGVKVIDYVLGALSVFFPEASKLDPGRIDPDQVPADRLK